MGRDLILYAPVIHKGYLDFFDRYKNEIETVYLIPDSLVERFSMFKPDIASLPAKRVRGLLSALGYTNVSIFDESLIPQLVAKPLIFINDRVSRALAADFFATSDLKWADVFLRWDIDSVYAEEVPNAQTSVDSFDVQFIQQAKSEALKSSDWWRQVGAVVVKDRQVIGIAHNEAMPSDHTPYQRGGVRDFVQTGERPELSDTIHAEQKIVADAARSGLSLQHTTLYVTHFPCPVCAKLIAHSGIKRCCFYEGSSSLKGADILKGAGVDLVRVKF